MSRNGYRTLNQGGQVTALLATMALGECYTEKELAMKLGWPIDVTRVTIHHAERSGVLWRRVLSGRPVFLRTRGRYFIGPLAQRDHERVEFAARQRDLAGYDQAWHTLRDLCMLVRRA